MLKNLKENLTVFILWVNRVLDWFVSFFDDIEYFFGIFLLGGVLRFLIKYKFIKSIVGLYRVLSNALYNSNNYKFYKPWLFNSFWYKIFYFISSMVIIRYFSFAYIAIGNDIISTKTYCIVGGSRFSYIFDLYYNKVLLNFMGIYTFIYNVFFIYSEYDFFHSDNFVTDRTFSSNKLYCEESGISFYIIENVLNTPAYFIIFYFKIIADFVVLQPYLILNFFFWLLLQVFFLKEYILIDLDMDKYVELIRYEFDAELLLISKRDNIGRYRSDIKFLNAISDLIYGEYTNILLHNKPYINLDFINYKNFLFKHSIYFSDCLNFFPENCIMSMPLLSAFMSTIKLNNIVIEVYSLDSPLISPNWFPKLQKTRFFWYTKFNFADDVRFHVDTPAELVRNYGNIHFFLHFYYLLSPVLTALWHYTKGQLFNDFREFVCVLYSFDFYKSMGESSFRSYTDYFFLEKLKHYMIIIDNNVINARNLDTTRCANYFILRPSGNPYWIMFPNILSYYPLKAGIFGWKIWHMFSDIAALGYFKYTKLLVNEINCVYNFILNIFRNNTIIPDIIYDLFPSMRSLDNYYYSSTTLEVLNVLDPFFNDRIFLNIFKNLDIIILLFVLFSIKIVRSNNVNSIFSYSVLLLLLNSFYLIINGLEPFVYFLIISEISALFIVYIITLSRKTRKKKTVQYLILFILPFLFFNKIINYNNFFFSGSNITIYLNSFNDFKFIINQIFIKNKNIFIILFFITLVSVIFVFIFRSRKVVGKSNSNLIKNNMHILNNFFLQKFKLF